MRALLLLADDGQREGAADKRHARVPYEGVQLRVWQAEWQAVQRPTGEIVNHP